MNIKKIYLDNNIIADYADSDRPSHKEIKDKILKLKDKVMFLYSPAHIEEIAKIYRHNDDINKYSSYVDDLFKAISDVTKNMETLSTSDIGIIIKEESPEICCEKVIHDYDKTLLAEDYANNSIGNNQIEQSNFKDKHSINTKILGSKKSEILFKDKNVISALDDFKRRFGVSLDKWEDIKNNHRKIEINISILSEFLI